LNRLITTFDEVPPFLSAEADMPPAIHIAGNDGVTFFKTCTAEVFRPIPTNESKLSFGSRSARTPPSTFLFLHLHLSNSPGSENPSPLTGSNPSETFQGKLFRTPHSTANDNRFPPAVESLISVRSLQARQHALAEGQCSAALSGAGYRPAGSALSTPDVKKSSYRQRESWLSGDP